jgi:hypothetical protein
LWPIGQIGTPSFSNSKIVKHQLARTPEIQVDKGANIVVFEHSVYYEERVVPKEQAPVSTSEPLPMTLSAYVSSSSLYLQRAGRMGIETIASFV